MSTPKVRSFRMTDDDYDALNAQAERAGMTVSRYIRYRTLVETPVAFVETSDIDRQLAGLEDAIARARQELSGKSKQGE